MVPILEMSITKGVLLIGSQVRIVPGPDPSDDDLKLLRYVALQEGGFGTVTEVNEKTVVGRRQTQNRLNTLVEQGLLKKRLVGRTNVFWVSDKGEEYLSNNRS